MSTVGNATEGFSIWWWLVFPVAVVITLGAFGQLASAFYMDWVHGEQGLLEMLQFAIALAGAAVSLRLLMHKGFRRRPLLLGWVGLATLSCFYIAGEEISWGQHLLYWSTPEYWAAINDQNETNLHNVSA